MKSLEKILSEKDLELHRNNPNAHPELLLRFIWKKENRNPTPDDIPPYKNSLWLNLKSGEIFVHLKTCNGKAFWKGQFGTIIATSTVNVFDIFGDGSAVALYRFDGNANDDGGQYNGTWIGSPQYDVGKFGQAAKFKPQDYSQYIELPKSLGQTLASSDGFSISLYFKPDPTMPQTGSQQGIPIIHFAQCGSCGCCGTAIDLLNRQEPYSLYIQVADSSCGNGLRKVYDVKVTSDNWYHVVLTNKGVYLNGEKLDSFDKGFGPNPSKVRVGINYCTCSSGDPCHNSHKYAGLVDQLRIFNRALTDEEVQVLYNEVEVDC